MIDLKKLEAKFKTFFEEETEESFNEWVEDKKKREILAKLGQGQVEKLKTPTTQGLELPCPNIFDFRDEEPAQIAGNNQYANAA